MDKASRLQKWFESIEWNRSDSKAKSHVHWYKAGSILGYCQFWRLPASFWAADEAQSKEDTVKRDNQSLDALLYQRKDI